MSVLTAQGGPIGRRTAVVIGVCIASGLYFVLSTLFGLVYVQVQLAQGVSLNEVAMGATQSSSYLMIVLALAFLGNLAGGAWTARLSESSPHADALIAGGVQAGLTLLSYLCAYFPPFPIWALLLSVAIPVAAFHVGATIHLQSRGSA
ncbi:hypothetical protein [Mitsuaria sp. 7]|uniref:hypothetical protein n=1 Tax=Mitsuaria sp. 7 TaxID=1658665 RepID=UPI0012FABEC5|nr:hypothetical protein [Mitsuaria sp. 7]